MDELSFSKGKLVLLDYLKNNGYKASTIKVKHYYLDHFHDYLNQAGILDLRDVSEEDLFCFVSYLNEAFDKRGGRLLGKRTKEMILCIVRLFFKSLYLCDHLLSNPARELSVRFGGQIREKEIFSRSEMGFFLDQICPDESIGLRDRALFELMYSSGLRRSDICVLQVCDIDFEERLLHIRGGKFSKDRIVPMSDVASLFLKRYLGSRKESSDYLFIGHKGNRLCPDQVSVQFKRYLKDCPFEREGLSCHSIRHSTASHLLECGAGLRYVQELLGHDSIETTAVYTHLSSDNLKRIYKSHHPRENLYYEELSQEYLSRYKAFKTRLEKQSAKRILNRASQHRYLLRKKKSLQ